MNLFIHRVTVCVLAIKSKKSTLCMIMQIILDFYTWFMNQTSYDQNHCIIRIYVTSIDAQASLSGTE